MDERWSWKPNKTNRRRTSKKKSSPLSLWATEMNFSKFRDRIFLMSFSCALFIISQISVADLRDSGVFSRYNLAAVSAAFEISLWNTQREVKMNDKNEQEKDISPHMSLSLEGKMPSMNTCLWAIKAKWRVGRITLYKNFTNMSKVRGYQVGFFSILASQVL